MTQKIGLVFFVLILINSCQNKYDSDIENQVNELIKLNEENLKYRENDQNYDLEDLKYDPNRYSRNINFSKWEEKYNLIETNSSALFEYIEFVIKVKQSEENYFIDKLIIKSLFEKCRVKNNLIIDTSIQENYKDLMKKDFIIAYQEDSARIFRCLELIGQNKANDLLLLNMLKIYFSNYTTNIQAVILRSIPIRMCCLGGDRFSTVAAVDKSVVLKNQMIEISAGVGSFDDKTKPKIKIQNWNIPLKDGMATTKIKAPNKVGTYRIPVVIDFTTAGGEQKREKRMIEYKVVDTICK